MKRVSQVDLDSTLRQVMKAPRGVTTERIQSLWGGYGAIFRFSREVGRGPTYIVKHVRPPSVARHPRGFGGDLSHARKWKSYRVEMNWYRDFAPRLGDACRVPRAVHLQASEDDFLFVLEDLDAAGFAGRRSGASEPEILACLRYLAKFHAHFLADPGVGLWNVGTYWHLETRPDELRALTNARLKSQAAAIDEHLNAAQFQTLVHGDAKLENFCFGSGGVATVDFQYAGRGVGVKDVAYFLSSCLDEEECLQRADGYVKSYFEELGNALARERPDVEAGAVIQEWRRLYAFAWADFMRFLLGWAPGHYKIHGYSQKMTEIALSQL